MAIQTVLKIAFPPCSRSRYILFSFLQHLSSDPDKRAQFAEDLYLQTVCYAYNLRHNTA